ncbi:WW domain binding protein 1-like [Acanthaster planci]|uniref:WW domain binding protein 1-like n=1 Tax=Acanthaster planci TaxID=133434 RepID=A0A8B7Y2R6_ACAPL|nr:WW domain binding protein 1-like [Acanthaster planci]
MAPGMKLFLLPVLTWLVCHFQYAAADICSDGNYCATGCCYDYDISYMHVYCCYSVVVEWWFWFMWGMLLFIILTTCCAIARRRQLRRRQVLVVQQGYTSPTAYGTLVNTEVPQHPYVAPGTYSQYPGGYPQPPPGPAPAANPAPPYQQVAAAGMQPALPVQQAGAMPSKVNQEPYNSNEKPPPYNPSS